MAPVLFHMFLDGQECIFMNFTGDDCTHCVYQNKLNGRKFTIPRDVESLMPETIEWCCSYLDIDLPTESGYSDLKKFEVPDDEQTQIDVSKKRDKNNGTGEQNN